MRSPIRWYLECPKPNSTRRGFWYRPTTLIKYRTDKGMMAHLEKCPQRRHQLIHIKPRETDNV